MKIGVFGGSFNPPHKMHLNIGLELVNKQYVDKVIYVPTGSKYKYKNNLLPDKNRLEMLEILTKTHEYLDVNDYELKDEVVYTCETLAYFKELYPNDDIYFVCGADNLSYIDKWKNGEDISLCSISATTILCLYSLNFSNSSSISSPFLFIAIIL